MSLQAAQGRSERAVNQNQQVPHHNNPPISFNASMIFSIFRDAVLILGPIEVVRAINNAIQIAPDLLPSTRTIAFISIAGAIGVFVAKTLRNPTPQGAQQEIPAMPASLQPQAVHRPAVEPSSQSREKRDFNNSVASSFDVRRPNDHVRANYHIATFENARQYDMAGQRPSACTFHALQAMWMIRNNFLSFTSSIRTNDSQHLALEQKSIIRRGLQFYEYTKQAHPDVMEGADLEHIDLPKGFPFKFDKIQNEVDGSFEYRLNQVVELLFSTPLTKVVWIKNGNEESFAVIKVGEQVIIFDSHQNEMIHAYGADATKTALRNKLVGYKNEVGGVDLTPFAYAIGHPTHT